MRQIDITQFRVSRRSSILLLIAAAVLWSLGGIFIKWVQWNPVAIAGTRSAISAIFIFLALKKPKLSFEKDQVICALSYAATVISFVIATKMTTAANAILLQYTAPIYVALLSYLVLKERITRLDWCTIAVVIGGMVLFFIDDIDISSFYGNLWAIFSGVSFAMVALYMRKQKEGSPIESILLGNILTAIIGIPFMLQSMPSTSSWIGLALMGTIQLGLPYVLYAVAIKSVTAIEAVLIPVIEPIINPIWVFLMLGETPGKWAVAGGIIVLLAVTTRCLLLAVGARVQIREAE
jgi:drug/metabolite transporter (DMT)-like permease